MDETVLKLISDILKLPSAERKEIVLEATGELAPNEKKEVAIKAANELGEEDKKEIIRSLHLPTQPTTDVIWIIIVAALALVLVGSAGAMIVLAYEGRGVGETLLSIFLAVLGYLAGLVTKGPGGK